MALAHNYNSPRALVVEPNPYHGEIIPGFVNYFQKLGYQVDVLMRPELAAENPLARYPKQELPTIYTMSTPEMRTFLSADLKAVYEVVFFSTNVWWERDVSHQGITDFLGFVPRAKKETLFIEHNLLCLDEDGAREMYAKGRVLTLLEYTFEGKRTKFINPHYFGTVQAPKLPGKKRKILVVGSSNRDPINLEAIFKAIAMLDNKYANDFEVTFAGGELDIPSGVARNTKAAGRLNSDDYFKMVEEHDFLLTLVDLNSTDIIHRKYWNGTTSATVLISLGFLKPMIMPELILNTYGFNADSSISFLPKDLVKTLEKVIAMPTEEYSRLVEGLQTLSKLLYDESLENLRHHLKPKGLQRIISRIRQ